MKYTVSFHAPGHVGQLRFITLKPSETLNLGEVVLERARRIAPAYRVAASPPFTLARDSRANRASRRAVRRRPVVRSEKRRGPLQRRSGFGLDRRPGTGALDEFLQVNPASVLFTSDLNLVAMAGHVYLLEQKP